MSKYAFFSFGTHSILHEISTWRDLVFNHNMQKFTVIILFTPSHQPMHAYSFLLFAIVDLSIL
jgi:hypothetical protein